MVEIRSKIEYFVRFIEKGFFFKKELLPDTHRAVILSLKIRLPDYHSCVHRRTANQTTTRKVDQAFNKMTPADLRKLQESDVVKEAIKERQSFDTARGGPGNHYFFPLTVVLPCRG